MWLAVILGMQELMGAKSMSLSQSARSNSRCLAVWLAAILVARVAVAQTTGDAEVTGLVKDPTGLPIPRATMSLTNQDTGVTRTVTSDAEGRYRFSASLAGRYTLRVEATGFVTANVTGIVLNIGAHVDHDVSLGVGNVQETVTVTAEVPPIDVTKNDVSGVVTNQQIDTLPINTRQFINLALLEPGTAQDSSRTFYNSVQMGGAGHYWSNGFFLDGVTNTWAEMGEPRQNVPMGAIQEFKVNTVQYKADQGLSAGGTVNIVTKSGTNEFHGEVFEYARPVTRFSIATTASRRQRSRTWGSPRRPSTGTSSAPTAAAPSSRIGCIFTLLSNAPRRIPRTPYSSRGRRASSTPLFKACTTGRSVTRCSMRAPIISSPTISACLCAIRKSGT
jgi:hypothetical protein